MLIGVEIQLQVVWESGNFLLLEKPLNILLCDLVQPPVQIVVFEL